MKFRKLKIAIVVHGRFHAFDIARELLKRGHDVTLFTNYPKFVVARFGVPGERVHSFRLHGGLTRATWGLSQKNILSYPEAWLHQMFGRWASAQINKERWDVVHSWSGVSEEIFRALAGKPTLKLLMRCSAHIRTQARLLKEEEHRTGAPQELPSSWIIAREEREYALADAIAVLSTFSYKTFIAEGVPPEKLSLLYPGVNLNNFRPTLQIVEARCQRILSGEPLRVLNVGTFSFRKGMWDMAAIIRNLQENRFRIRFVGPITQETLPLVESLRSYATFIPKQPQKDLPVSYVWGDIYITPTIEDGYQYVMAQAAASALPILTTTNGAGYDLVQDGVTGWVLPIRNSDAFIKRLHWCDTHREELVNMVQRVYHEFQHRDWAEMATDFEALCVARLDLHPERKISAYE